MPFRVALIGSFREQNYPRVLQCMQAFSNAGLTIVSPHGTEIVSGVEFVRFESDPSDMSDPEIQSITMERILSADAVYVVVADQGHVGKTTCYEIGRIVHAGQPIYFSERPADLPVHIPDVHVVDAETFVLRFVTNGERPEWPFASGIGALFDVERRIVERSEDQAPLG